MYELLSSLGIISSVCLLAVFSKLFPAELRYPNLFSILLKIQSVHDQSRYHKLFSTVLLHYLPSHHPHLRRSLLHYRSMSWHSPSPGSKIVKKLHIQSHTNAMNASANDKPVAILEKNVCRKF